MNRSAGILMPITSLPSPYGIGTMGRAAREFTDFLEKSGQSCWQILPIGPTGYGDSPYQSFSSYAGNPYLIDLDALADDGLLDPEEYMELNWGSDPKRTDYGVLYEYRLTVLRKACRRLAASLPPDYHSFLQENGFWLEDYALFMALKERFGGVSWTEWDPEVRVHKASALMKARVELQEEIAFWEQVQFLFFRQWKALREYVHAAGIRLIGDLPIYAAADSADVWANQRQFRLDEEGRSTTVAGCPPDSFSATGQLWGNPLYRWDRMKEEGYSWWTKRIAFQFRLFDVLRIDHFRGFESFYAIPAGEETAMNGTWEKGPGIEFFRQVENQLGKLDIIAEDLGYLTPEVNQLVKESGYPGMKVLQFGFDPREPGDGYLPHQHIRNCVVYTGTHDNDTALGWLASCPAECTVDAREYLNLNTEEGLNWGMIRGAYMSVADLAVIPMQDVLGLGGEARMNVPSTTGNWTWRMQEGSLTAELAEKLLRMTELFGRRKQE